MTRDHSNRDYCRAIRAILSRKVAGPPRLRLVPLEIDRK